MGARLMPLDEEQLMRLSLEELAWLNWQEKWTLAARDKQLPPLGEWLNWIVQAGRGFGKELTLCQKLPTPSGWTTVGDLRVGDVLFDEEGRETRVLALHPINLQPESYRLTFSDGATINACADHLWTTWTHRDRKQFLRRNPGATDFPAEWHAWALPDIRGGDDFGPRVRTTREIRDTLTYNDRGDLNHCVPVARPLRLPEQQLPVPPWTMGYWLGNGDTKTGTVTAGSHKGEFDDLHVERMLAADGLCSRLAPRDRGCTRVTVPGLAATLRDAGVLGDKHIPAAYLRASIEQRLALLRGLMDSDGYGDDGKAEFCSTDEPLARGLLELVRSLGERPVIAESRAQLNGRDMGPRWRVTWRWSLFNPFSLHRKAVRCPPPASQALRLRHRMIVSVEPIEPVPMRCITVDSPSGLFLAGEAMIPTHNTRTGAEWLANEAWMDPGSFNTVIAPTFSDAKLTCFEGESGLLAVIPPELIADYHKTDLIITLKNGSVIRGFSSEKPDRLRGPQSHRGWCDEIAAWQNAVETWDMYQFGLRLGNDPRTVITSTPKPVQIVRTLLKEKSTVVTRGSTYENRANLASKFLDKIASYEGTKLGRQEIHGELLDPEEAGIVRRSQFKLWPAHKPLPAFEYVIMSLDTAFTEKTRDKKTGDPDPTGCVVLGLFWHDDKPAILYLDAWEDMLSFPALVERVKKEMAQAYGEDDKRPIIGPLIGSKRPQFSGRKPDLLIIEDKGSGISLRQQLAAESILAYPYNPGRADKLTRLHLASDIFEQGYVWVVESAKNPGAPRTWMEPVITQLCTFTGEGSIPHDEFVDCTTQAIAVFKNKFLHSAREPSKPRAQAPRVVAERTVNPYAA
jgi:hypothetical protein